MEREADTFAADVLKMNGLSAEPLIGFLERMESGDAARAFDRAPAFLTTHPSTGERVRNLRDAMAKR
jgi:predicted Zn-dependent protease